MFGLIKKAFTPTPIATVADVHEDFDTAHERILTKSRAIVEEAKQILNREIVKEDENLSRLEKMGFSNLPQVKEKKEVEELIETATDSLKTGEREAKRVLAYLEKYPNNKFINQEELTEICRRYGLVTGTPAEFIGEIPLKNQKEILEFKLHENDYFYYTTSRYGERKTTKKAYEEYKRESNCADTVYCEKDPKLYIVGTIDQFDMQGKKISADFRIVDEDPVVLAEVEGGYIIVSKWGAEADLKEFN